MSNQNVAAAATALVLAAQEAKAGSDHPNPTEGGVLLALNAVLEEGAQQGLSIDVLFDLLSMVSAPLERQ